MKSKLNLEGLNVQQLSVEEMKKVNGGKVWFFSWWVRRPAVEHPDRYSTPVLA